MSEIFITDYVTNPNIEKKVLKDKLAQEPTNSVKVLLVWHENVGKEYLDRFPNLIGIVRYGVGVDSINIDEVKKRKLILCNTPDYGVDEVSDTALSMIMNFNRGISQYNRLAKKLHDSWETNTIKHLKRTKVQSLGVLGAGSIGASLMLKAKALGFNVSFYDPYKESGFEKSLGVSRYYNMDEIVNNSDILSIHIPLNSKTKGLVDEEFIAKMKKGSTLINTSRGKILKNLDILFEPLLEGQLNYVGLDVLPDEPPTEGLLINAWRDNDERIIDKILINPHTSYYSKESYVEMRRNAASNALDILNGENPRNIVIDAR